MLAYVFWHWPQPTITPETYVNHLIDFHQTLAANKPPGFHHSVVFRIRGASWLNTTDEAYEEWYLLDDSAAMDPLNDAAVSGVCEEPHNRVAREAADGTGGLYRLRAGQGELSEARFVMWLSKPEGVSYKDFYTALQPLTSEPGVALWGRQMTLGPTTEFCIHSTNPIELPAGFDGLQPQITRIIP
ncbi:MAG TPA: hypothetical protein VFS90_19550 [Pyrinomonadaceae bacterium]|nr:hypothetical protein [Pyrinomonadaceae bacterium]